ncbi:MAG: gluconate 2-dehydrogenase subunit 3 family protein [Chitinophagaceae bacterium]|nr:gluconate 2-dehydrogenase subunit 3 family protein [Chitinophagaceae bacterium]
MERRELIKTIAALTGGAFIGGGILTGCKSEGQLGGISFSNNDILFLDEVAETIIPATKTPGAKAAKVGDLMKVMVNDTYDEKDQQVFHKGIILLNEACKKTAGKSFMDATPGERTALLTAIDAEAKAYQKIKKEGAPAHYFTMMKQLTLLGYFTSREGATQALRYLPVPGKYVGDFPYKKGDKAWAS